MNLVVLTRFVEHRLGAILDKCRLLSCDLLFFVLFFPSSPRSVSPLCGSQELGCLQNIPFVGQLFLRYLFLMFRPCVFPFFLVFFSFSFLCFSYVFFFSFLSCVPPFFRVFAFFIFTSFHAFSICFFFCMNPQKHK